MPIIKALALAGAFLYHGGIMKKSLKFFLSIVLLNFFVISAFAEGYHVCVASYKQLKNAEEMVIRLEKQSMASFVSESKVKNESYYRVLLSKEFKKIADARKYRDEVKNYSFVKELGLKDFWVCKSEKIIQKNSPVQTAPVASKKAEPAPAPIPEVKIEPKAEPKPEPLPKAEPLPVPEEPKTELLAPEPEPEPEPEPTPAPVSEPLIVEVAKSEVVPEISEEPKNLDKNEKAVLSEEMPYSVQVRSYKYEQFAQNDSNRLKELGFDPYMLKTFDPNEFFAFNIHVGAFASRKEAEELQAQFTDAGIADTVVSDYREIEARIKKYDEIIAREPVAFNDGKTEISTCLSSPVEKIVSQFPANKDFPIQEIIILDYDNYLASSDKPTLSSDILGYIGSENSVEAALLATCRDELYQKNVNIFMVAAEQFPSDDFEGEADSMQLGARNGVFDCELYENNGETVLFGKNIAEKLFVRISSNDFTRDEFINFLIDSFNDGSLSLFPQMRRTFFVLPDSNEEESRSFICFDFKKVDESYSRDRNNAEWALPIVGHSLAKSYFIERSALLCVGFYDLDYDFNVRSVHEHFTTAKNSAEISSANQPISFNALEGWYLSNSSQKEISFSTKSYVIALDTAPNSILEKEDLIQFGKDLKIWDSDFVASDSMSDAK